MNIRQSRLAEVTRTYTSEDILAYTSLHEHPHGIISVTEVIISSDYSYADVYVQAEHLGEKLPKFLSPLSKRTRTRIMKDYSIWKVPEIRYRIGKKWQTSDHILTLINSLDSQYGLSQEDTPIIKETKE